jgi:hypothetical protein
MGRLRNPKRENFARHVAEGADLAGAFVLAGYEASSAAGTTGSLSIPTSRRASRSSSASAMLQPEPLACRSIRC